MTGDEIEVPILVFDATGPIGFAVRFSDGDWESYRIAGLEFVGRHRTKAEAAAALAALGRYGAEDH
jgi:hypothetical protein